MRNLTQSIVTENIKIEMFKFYYQLWYLKREKIVFEMIETIHIAKAQKISIIWK